MRYRMKRLLAELLSAVMLLSLLPAMAAAFTGGGGNGTDGDPYLIATKEQLIELQNYVNSGNDCAGLYFKLTDNIDLEEEPWTPIGTEFSIPFQGIFDGGGHTIRGLYINNSSDNQGLFGVLTSGGTVKNLAVEGSVTGGSYVGGIVGQCSQGTISGCRNAASVSGTSNVGGIVGSSYLDTVIDCYNTGAVTGNSASGGIAGFGYATHLENCCNLGTVSGSGFAIGSVVGSGSGATVTNCYYLTGTAAKGVGDGVSNGIPEEKTAEEFRSLAGALGDAWEDDFLVGHPVLKDNRETAAAAYTEEHPYVIPDKKTLEVLRDYVNAGHTCEGIYFKLTADIDLEEEPWTPIGIGYGIAFGGTFDGGGHTISGLNVHTSADAGLFGVVYNGHIKNLSVAGTVTSTDTNAGGIVGTLGDETSMEGSVTNCHSSVIVTGDGYTGGIVGEKYGSTVSGCVNTGAVSDRDGDAGGIAGANFGGAIENCYNTGDVFGGWRAGGITASNFGREWTAPAEVKNCYNVGAVSGAKDIGGILGSSSGSVTDCYYLYACGAAGEGTAKTADEFSSGEVAYLLQAGQSAQIWGQTVGSGYPELTGSAEKKVYQVTFRADLTPEYEKTLYANPDGTLPAAETLKPEKEGYTFVKWALTDSPDGEAFTASTQVYSDLTLYAIFEEKATEPTPTESKPTEPTDPSSPGTSSEPTEPAPSKSPGTSEASQNPTGGPSGEGSNNHSNDTPKTGDESQLSLWLALTLLSLAGAAVTAPIMGRKGPAGPQKGNEC